ncbi:hypothetical protein ACWEKT_27535 [Nocardia takedensis]
MRAGAPRVQPSTPAIPDRRASPPLRSRARRGPLASMVAAALLIGVCVATPTHAQAPVGPGPGLFTIRPLDDLDRVLTVEPAAQTATLETDADDPAQTVRVRPVRRLYNLFNQRSDGYLDNGAGRVDWTDRMSEWQVVAVDGFGPDVFLIQWPDLDGTPLDVVTYLGDTTPPEVRPAAAPTDPAYRAQLWKFERARENEPRTGTLESDPS